ncbi:site-specific DNA-methyltransferase [Agrococcus versicolor]|uniref:site-specific DNA-methyltransferase n=1 Tax=Agrococcus versicolor TaxID=501482 RepID=UPI0031DF4B6F
MVETRDKGGAVRRAIDFDALRQELSDHIVEGPQERYHLNWPGKRAASFVASAPTTQTLRPMRHASVDFDTTRNLFVEGDNLEALKILQESYLGKVKLIYIDPPYNTGNDFVYSDDFSQSTESYLERTGQRASTGERLKANLESNGRFHSDWLSMMYPRLKLARNLLREDGVIFMSINDAEFENLKHLGNEVFGAGNFVGTMVWAAGRKNDSRFISASHEYIICFARDLTGLRERAIDWKVRKRGLDAIYKTAISQVRLHDGDFEAASAGLRKWYSSLPDGDESKRNKHYSRVDARGVYFPGDISWPNGGGPRFEVLHPKTGRPVRIPTGGWRLQQDAMATYLREDRIHFGPDETTVPTIKRYLQDTEMEVAYSVFYQDGRAATKRLRELLGAAVFDFPKDETVLQTLVDMTTADDDIVMDFFAGSGSMAHAVMAANASDRGRRRFVLVQLDETVDPRSGAAKAGFSHIAEISRERIRRAADEIRGKSDLGDADFGFRALRVGSSNFVDVLTTADELDQATLLGLAASIHEDRSDEDLLFQVLLEWGVDPTLPLEREQIDGQTIMSVDGGALLACFSERLTEAVVLEMARRQPLRAVVKDAGFVTDAARINAEQVFAELAPGTRLRAL